MPASRTIDCGSPTTVAGVQESALASKATGYPLAYVAAKIALGYALSNLAKPLIGLISTWQPALALLLVVVPTGFYAWHDYSESARALDADLQLLREDARPDFEAYDPRTRSWYRQAEAVDRLIYTEPRLAPGGSGPTPAPPDDPPSVSAYTGFQGDQAPPPGFGQPPAVAPGPSAPDHLPAVPSPALYPGAPLPNLLLPAEGPPS